MSELITVEAVTTKFANKYNSGSVKVGDKWLQVAKNIDISMFQKDSQVNVETKTNDKGYTSIVKVVDEAVETVAKEEPKKTKTMKERRETEPVVVKTYEENKNRRILVQGIVQSCAASPSLAGLPFTSASEVVNNIKNVALELIKFVDEESK